MSDMIDVCIDADEAYPVYFVHTADDFWKSTGSVDTETYERWTRVVAEYNQIQDEMASFHCLNINGEHTFVSIEPGRGVERTYCKHCHTDKGATPWI